MHLIAIGWLYVALMAAVVEAASPQGSVLGAVFTFVGYGVLPLAIVLYVMGSRHRRAAQRAADAAASLHDAMEGVSILGSPPLQGPRRGPFVAPGEGGGEGSQSTAAPRRRSPDAQGLDPDRGSHAAGHAVTPERIEP